MKAPAFKLINIVTLLLASGLANAQSLATKWAIGEPETTFVEATNSFTLTFDLDTSIVQANTAAMVYEEDCIEELLAPDGIVGTTTAVNTPGEATLSFDLNTEILSQNNDVFTDLPATNSAEMRLCARFTLQTGGGINLEVNFVETIITVFFDLTAGFELDGFNTQVKAKGDPNLSEFDKGYDVIAYLCDPSDPSVALTDKTFSQGAVISVCVTPTPEALADGLLIETIERFDWVRGFIEQPAIEATIAASNSLTSYACTPGSLYCTFSSLLFADFYRPPTLAPTQTPTLGGTICAGVNASSATVMDFFGSTVKQSDLQSGGELRYGDIGIIDGEAVDLLVTSTDYYHPNPAINGKSPAGTFGEIGVRTLAGEPDSGKGTFEFCFVENNTYTPVMARSFQWAVFDLDNRGGSPGLVEKLSIDVNQTSGYTLYPDNVLTEVSQTCENDGSAPPCDEGVRTLFQGTTVGGGSDNPTDPYNMTEQQMRRSVVFTFTNTSCWTFEFNAYCPSEPGSICSWYGGSKLLYSGTAPQIIANGLTECTPTSPDRRYLEEIETRDLQEAAAEVAGYGVATLMFTRRRAEEARFLQDSPTSDIELTVAIETVDEEYTVLRTSGGPPTTSYIHLLVLGIFVHSSFLLF